MNIWKEKMRFFEKHLSDFFKKAGREHLPWRTKNITAYEVWVSEIMLQQTQVSRVIGYYAKFLKRFPTVEALAETAWKDFLPYYAGLGYYARGRNMLKTANIIVTQYGGTFPRDKKSLEELPGIGPYTAAAIMSFAYGDDHIAWDTNVRRVIGRFFLGDKQALLDTDTWERDLATSRKTLNAALMDFGSALCVARPKCAACSLKLRCVFYKERGKQEKIQNTRYKIRNTTQWNEARAYVFLHENHKKYFSASQKTFRPFVLPSGYHTRPDIKKFFQKKYTLTLSVRPPHARRIVRGMPALLINAQILSGEPTFRVFPRSVVTRYTDRMFSPGKQ